jgi:hypothetical protein
VTTTENPFERDRRARRARVCVVLAMLAPSAAVVAYIAWTRHEREEAARARDRFDERIAAALYAKDQARLAEIEKVWRGDLVARPDLGACPTKLAGDIPIRTSRSVLVPEWPQRTFNHASWPALKGEKLVVPWTDADFPAFERSLDAWGLELDYLGETEREKFFRERGEQYWPRDVDDYVLLYDHAQKRVLCMGATPKQRGAQDASPLTSQVRLDGGQIVDITTTFLGSIELSPAGPAR